MLRKLLIITMTAAALSACGGSDDNGDSKDLMPTANPTPQPTPTPNPTPTPDPNATPVPTAPPTPTPEVTGTPVPTSEVSPTPTPEVTPTPVPSNILPNSDLELGSGDEFTDWGKWNGPNDLTATTSEACSGRALQVVAAGEEHYNRQFVSPEFSTVVGDKYTASTWIKSTVADAIFRFSTKPDTGAIYQDDVLIGTDWEKVTFTFTAYDTTSRISLDLGKSATTFYVDNIELTAGEVATSTACPGVSNPTPTPTPEDTNILPNSDLSVGDGNLFTAWTILNGASAITAITSDTCFGRGLQAASPGGNIWDVQLSSEYVPTVNGNQYTASMWIKGSVADGVVRFEAQSATSTQYQSPEATIGTDWQQVAWTFPADDTSTRLVLDLGANNVTYNIDDIKLVPGTTADSGTCPNTGPAVGTDLTANGGLEFGSGDDFTGWGKWNGAANLTATTTEVRTGSRALQAVGVGANAYDVQLASDPIPTVENSSYQASMWIKGAVDGGEVQLSTNASAGNQYSGMRTVGTSWQQITWSFIANDQSTRLVLDLGASSVTYYIDDIELIEE